MGVSIREEILMTLHRYENKVRGIECSIKEAAALRHGDDIGMLTSRKNAYTMDMIPDLKRLLELVPVSRTATIVLKFPETGEEVEWGTFDYNTPGEKARVNEMAMQMRYDRHTDTEVRINS